jgi:uncharacterized protein (TIGR02646 family)
MSLAELETKAAISFFSNPAHYKNNKKITSKKQPEFSAYKDKELVALIIQTFHNKCAYCESVFAHASNGDIEHFRPKKKIVIDRGELIPGYYWLAIDWNNLFLSCSHCNRRQYHQTPDKKEKILMGKQNFFPLSNERKRIRKHTDDIKNENPYCLLINPCIQRKPDSFFEFLENGIVRPSAKKGREYAMAKTSIEVYALYRKNLVEERKRNCYNLILQLKTLDDAAIDLIDARKKQIKRIIKRRESQFDREWQRFAKIFESEKPYLAMKRQFLLKSIANGALDAVIRLGKNPSDLL